MAFRSPRKSSSKSAWKKVSQVLPIWTPANTAVANLFFKDVLEKLGITDIRSYFQKWRIPIAISIVVCAWVGAASDGLKGFVIGGLLGIVAPIALLWLGVMLSLIALFLAIYVAAWAVIVFIVWAIFH
jgi:hypothetical protein